MDFLNELTARVGCLSPIIWILAGILGGDISRRLMRERDVSWLNDLILGSLGGVLGGVIAALAGLGVPSGFWVTILMVIGLAIGGSMVLIGLYRLLFPKTSRSSSRRSSSTTRRTSSRSRR